jgi:hypothetical protein
MSKIIGVTVGTPNSPAKMGEALKPVKTVNGIPPDETGNVDVSGFRGDWNQNDPTAQDYVKNRPFYSEESWAVVHEEQTVHFMTDSYGIQGVWIHAAPHICDAYPVGTTCKVVIDGEEFVGVIDSQNNNRYFGNAHLYWHDLADTGESFCVASGGLDTLFIYTTKPVTMCKVSVLACDGETVKKLDAKYLPDVVAKQKPLTFTGAVEATYDGSKAVEVVIPQGGEGVSGGLTTAQIAAIDELFKIAAYTEDASSKYTAFRAAFGLDNSGGDSGEDESGEKMLQYTISSLNDDGSLKESNERVTTDYIPYTNGGAISINGYKYILYTYDADKKFRAKIIKPAGWTWYNSGDTPNVTSPFIKLLIVEENFSGDMTIEQGQLDGAIVTVDGVEYTLIGA